MPSGNSFRFGTIDETGKVNHLFQRIKAASAMLRKHAQSLAPGGLIAAAGRIPPGDYFAAVAVALPWHRAIRTLLLKKFTRPSRTRTRVVWGHAAGKGKAPATARPTPDETPAAQGQKRGQRGIAKCSPWHEKALSRGMAFLGQTCLYLAPAQKIVALNRDRPRIRGLFS